MDRIPVSKRISIFVIMNRIVLVIALILYGTTAFAQDSTTAPDDPTRELRRFAGNIRQFNSVYPQEKVYLEFDNTSYYTGETIWFKAFVVSAPTLKNASSKVLYVDLLSADGTLLQQEKLKIEDGQADGSFQLKDGATLQARRKRGTINYSSGFYEIRAYTSYMLNFGDDIVFSRVFAVYERPKEEGNYYSGNPIITKRKTEPWELRPKTENLRKINCSFYPEGGHLILGKTCRIAFKVTDDKGFGIDATGVLDKDGLAFSTVHDGMGWFTFTPRDQNNQVEITVGNDTRTFTLPQPEQTGCALSIDPCATDSIVLKVDCTEDLPDNILGMTITCRGELMEFCTLDATHPVEKSVPMAQIPEGVCRICIFDRTGNIYASRSIYHRSTNSLTPVLEVKPDKEQYGPFEKMSLQFSLKDGQSKPLSGRFCLSVRDVNGQANACADNLRTSLLLSSDLKGLIENPSWYFDSVDDEHNLGLDLLMLVQGWDRYDWQTMSGQRAFSREHSLDESLAINGWVLNSSGKRSLAGIKVNALLAMQIQGDEYSKKYSCVTDSSGYFSFIIEPEFYGKASFAIHAKAPKRIIGTDARIRFERSMTPAVRPYNQQELIFVNAQGNPVQSVSINDDNDSDQLPIVINADDGLLLPDVDINEKRKYIDYFTFTAYDVSADVEVELDKGDYTTDMMGYLIDKGYAFNRSKKDGIQINGFKPFYYIHDTNTFYYAGSDANPDTKHLKSILVYDNPVRMADILDECTLIPSYMKDPFTSPLFSISTTFHTQGLDEELNERYMFIDILVKEKKELGKKDDLYNINKRITTVDGYSIPYSFYSPEYPDGPILGDIDVRRTLYWNPNVITDSEGHARVEFYNNSYSQHYSINGAGITASGIPYILNQNW